MLNVIWAAVAGTEWDRMEEGLLGEALNPWGAPPFNTLVPVELDTAIEEAAYGK